MMIVKIIFSENEAMLNHVLALALDNDEELSPAIQTIVACFKGDDSFIPPTFDSNSPFYVILSNMAKLALGRGSKKEYVEIQQQVDTMLQPERVKANLPFLTPKEMKTVIQQIRLHGTDGRPLFEAEWFAPGHPLAKWLNAKPSEFVATIEQLNKEETSA